MRAGLVCAVAATAVLAGGCGGGGTSTHDAADAYVASADKELGGMDPAVAAAVARYQRCAVIETTAPLAHRAAIDKEAQGIFVFVSLHSLPARYHRFRQELDGVKTDDPGLLRVRAAVHTLDARLRKRRFPSLDVCTFLRDWKAANWETTGRFEAAWFARHGYSPTGALGPAFGAPVHAVASRALAAAGVSQADAARFAHLAGVIDPAG